MSLEKLHDILEWPFMIFFIVGVITCRFKRDVGRLHTPDMVRDRANASPDDRLF